MQLTEAGPPGGAAARLRLSPFARTLLTLCICTAPVLGGVLPEERADVLYHYYNGGDITVEGPSVLIRKNAGDNLSFTANYYEDMISSASIDVKLSASPYHETRKQWSGGVEYLHGKSTYSAGVITSKEPDYKANTMFYNVSQDMFGDLTTITLGYRRGWDQIYRDIKENGEIINDPTFHERADHRGYTFALSQILTRNLIANLNYELLTDQGYLQNPYRQIRYSSPGVGEGFTLANQVYPDTRTSNAGSLSLKYYLSWRASVTAQYRYFRDTWDIVANTFEVDYTHGWHNWIFEGALRYYHQTPASFYSDLFPRANYQNFMARDRELAGFDTYTARLGVTYQFPHVAWAPWVSRSQLNIQLEHFLADYNDFRDALLAAEYGAGNEPLYKLNANVFTVQISAWY